MENNLIKMKTSLAIVITIANSWYR